MQSAEEIRSLVDRVRAQLGGPDILVNNAGVQHVCNVEEFPPEKWEELKNCSIKPSGINDMSFSQQNLPPF